MKNDFLTQNRILQRVFCILLAFLMSITPAFSAFATDEYTNNSTAETESTTSSVSDESFGETTVPDQPSENSSDEVAALPETLPEGNENSSSETPEPTPPSGESSDSSSEVPESSESSSENSSSEASSQPETENNKDLEEEKNDELQIIRPEEEEKEIEIEEISISTPEELKAFADRVNAGDSMENAVVTLKANINLSSLSSWTPIGATADTPFCGVFDGANKTISNIKTDENTYGGLFGFLAGAEIKNVNLKNVTAPNSTQGLFFACANTEFTNCFVKSGFLGLQKSVVTYALPVVTPWDGTRSVGWYAGNMNASVFILSTAEELADFAFRVNGGVTFSGKTIIVNSSIDLNGSTHNWKPIGQTNSFQGTFQVLGDNMIMNLSSTSGGLFGSTENAVIKNVFLYNANVTTTSSVGGIVNVATDTAIQNCVLSNSNIKSTGNGAAGIVFSMGYSSKPGFVTQCLVENSTIETTNSIYNASGIINSLSNFAVSQNIVYGSKIISAKNASGIAQSASGPNGTYASVSENLVLNTYLQSPSSYGIIQSISGWNTTTNNFISDVNFSSSAYIGTDGTPNGVDSYFTDSALNLPLVKGSTFVANNYWDSSVIPDRTIISGKTESFSTAYLTNGEFNINTSYWTAEKNYYPRLSALSNSANKSMKSLTGLASVAVLMEDPEDGYSGTKGIILLSKTPEGDNITWSYSNTTLSQKPALDALSVQYGIILYNEDNTPVVISDLKATIADPTDINVPYVKHFPAITLLDVLLKEDISGRVPSITSTEASPVLVPTSLKPILVYEDDIEINESANIAYLETSVGGSAWSAVALVDCSVASPNFTLDPSTKTVTFDFTDYSSSPPVNPLRAGTKYRVVIPAGAVKELGKGNYNEEIIMYFEIAATQAPFVKLGATPNEYVVGETITLSDLSTWFSVSNMGQELTFTSGDLTPVPSSWVLGSKELTLENITNELRTSVTPPNNTDVKVYYWSDINFGSPLTARGKYSVYVFALNADSRTSYREIAVHVQSTRYWDPVPNLHLHMPWTDDPSYVELYIENDLSAFYNDSGTSKIIADKFVEVDAAMWAANVTTSSDIPFKVNADVYVLDKYGVKIPSTKQTIEVFIDINASALVTDRYISKYAPATTSEIEALMMATVIDGSNYTAVYNHIPAGSSTPNDYSVAGTYEASIILTPTGTISMCPISGPGHSVHSTSTATFTINIIPVPVKEGEGVVPFWDKVKEDAKTSNDYVEIARNSTPSDMPSGVLTVLRDNRYNNLKLNLGKYRWNFYGHAIKEQPVWRVEYPLDITFEDNAKVTALIEGYKGVQFTFAVKGKLYADVGLDIWTNGSAGDVWTLYSYNKAENKLEYVSDAIMDGHWAQTLIDYAEDTTYVVSTLPYVAKVEAPVAKTENNSNITINNGYGSGLGTGSNTQSEASNTQTPGENTENNNSTTNNNTENSTDVPANAAQTPALNLGAVLGAGAAGGALLLGAVVIRKKSKTKGE